MDYLVSRYSAIKNFNVPMKPLRWANTDSGWESDNPSGYNSNKVRGQILFRYALDVTY